MKWICALCNKPGACEFCEMCAEHCVAKRQNDVEAHRKFDSVVASVDPEVAAGLRQARGGDQRLVRSGGS